MSPNAEKDKTEIAAELACKAKKDHNTFIPICIGDQYHISLKIKSQLPISIVSLAQTLISICRRKVLAVETDLYAD